MGLFDFLKKKNTNTTYQPIKPAEEKKPDSSPTTSLEPSENIVKKSNKDIKPLTDIPPIQEETASEPISNNNTEASREPYYGDLEKTGILVDLCSVPLEQRDDNWFAEFISNVPLASFRTTEKQVITGPDGFPYFQLELPEPGVQFQCYVLDNMVYDFLLTNGIGVAINSSKAQPDWVFTYGDIFNYAIKKDFYNKDNTNFNRAGEEQITPSDMNNNVMVGQPSEFILPNPARAVLKGFLQFKQIQDPKVMLMTIQTPDGKEAQDLVFNFTPQDFASEEDFQTTIQQMQWFLPRHYSLAFFQEDESLKEHFQAL
ncbi:MAG: hypothetical protein DI598_01120 [Pseudopedobacter saltans]|uniref:Uncharacterized protein n=1 Tax=Pseudopedobacter saltans TaxID=151895 RepID=A0A2W5FF30_9SPHI|nr:MAG: hypothetical protein DI598_01120 [Pseudopedobacter saltans]